jgi:hypothetical protein
MGAVLAALRPSAALRIRREMVEHIHQLSSRRRIRQLLTIFFSLQILDVLTTLLGLRLGASEGSIFIGRLLQIGPATGLVLSKCIATTIAAAALMTNRERLLRFVNFWFVIVVSWNLVIIRLFH